MKPNVQRPLNSAYRDKIGRDGAPKNIVDAPPSFGMRRQQKGGIGFHGGVAVDDLPNTPLKSHEKPIAVHPSMTPTQVAKHSASPSGPEILNDAANLGRGKPKNEPRPRPVPSTGSGSGEKA